MKDTHSEGATRWGGDGGSRNGTVRHINSLGGCVAEMLGDPSGAGKLSIIVIFISRCATPDD